MTRSSTLPDSKREMGGEELDRDIDDGFCADCNVPWEQCDCTFLVYVCGMGADGYCSHAGTEDCDWECPRGGLA